MLADTTPAVMVATMPDVSGRDCGPADAGQTSESCAGGQVTSDPGPTGGGGFSGGDTGGGFGGGGFDSGGGGFSGGCDAGGGGGGF